MKNNNIKTVIDILRSDDFYGGGDSVEIAKGRNQIVYNWKGAKTKLNE